MVYSQVFNTVEQGNFNSVFNQIFLPTSISNIAAWHDASDISTITHVGKQVSAWSDKAGAGHALIAGAGDEPETGVHTQNGINVLFFDGGSDLHSVADFNVTASHTILVAYKPIAVDNAADSIFSLNNTGGGEDYQIDAGGVGQFTCEVTSTNLGIANIADPTDRLGQFIVTTVRWDAGAGTLQLYTNGSLVNSDGGYNGNMDPTMDMHLGTNRNNNQFLEGDIAEFIVYSKAMGAGERQQVEDYLIAKWGI